MKALTKRIISLLLVACTLVMCLVACGPTEPEDVDYAASIEFDPTSTDTVKQEVTIKSHIDGDTTHFYVPDSISDTGVLKARYLGINTPESTGQIQEWGKKAKEFTKSKLESATSIYIESDNQTWNLDSTGSRYTVWVWYKPEGSDAYRNLNIEIMQNGLAIQSNSSQNRYGTQLMAAYAQAERQALHVHSNEKDPEFFYGEAVELTLRELRANVSDYVDKRVGFEGVVVKSSGQGGVYIEAYDEETDMYNGMYVYLSMNPTAFVKQIFKLGNRVHVIGKVSEYNGTYQVSDVSAAGMRPSSKDSTRLDNEVHSAAYKLTDAEVFRNGEVSLIATEDGEEVTKKFKYAELALGSSISFENLRVVDSYTTTNPASSSKGAFTLYCEDIWGNEVAIRTIKLFDENDNLVLASDYVGETINVKGIVDYYNPNASGDEDMGEVDGDFYYQIKVTVLEDLEIVP